MTLITTVETSGFHNNIDSLVQLNIYEECPVLWMERLDPSINQLVSLYRRITAVYANTEDQVLPSDKYRLHALQICRRSCRSIKALPQRQVV
jgi:hypothetical protein